MILKNAEDRLIEICCAALSYEEKRDLSFLEHISKFNKYARSVLLEHDLQKIGYSIEDRIKLFEIMTDKKTQNIVSCWRENNIFVALVRYINRSIPTESDSIPWQIFDIKNISATHIKVKNMMMRNMPDQRKIESLVSACLTPSTSKTP